MCLLVFSHPHPKQQRFNNRYRQTTQIGNYEFTGSPELQNLHNLVLDLAHSTYSGIILYLCKLHLILIIFGVKVNLHNHIKSQSDVNRDLNEIESQFDIAHHCFLTRISCHWFKTS